MWTCTRSVAWVLFALLLAGPGLAGAEVVPNAAPPGAVVSISGGSYGEYRSSGDNRVLFAGVPALVQRWEPDLIEVRVPFKAKAGKVSVVRGKKTAEAGSFTVTTPTIKGVAPGEVEHGATLQISGEHFGNTAGSRDPNTMFGVNQVLVGGVQAKIRRWRDDKIEVVVPANAETGDVVVRLASSDPLPDGSCCAPVEYAGSNTRPVKILPSIRMDPDSGPVGTKVVLFGRGFGETKGPTDAVLINGRPATVAQWKDQVIVVHVPLEASSGPLVLRRAGRERAIGNFSVYVPQATSITPTEGPIGTLLTIKGEHFGLYSESGATPYSFTDFSIGDNRVEIGGIPAVVYRWHDDRIDVWVPASAKSGPVVVHRGGGKPKEDGSCCAQRGEVMAGAGHYTVLVPQVASYSPKEAGLDDIVTITGSGFGSFVKSTEATQPELGVQAFDLSKIHLGQDVSRSEVLFNGIAGLILSWTDTEIQVRVPRRPAFGIGSMNEFNPDLTTGPLVVRRGSWDVLPNGECCTPKQWVTAEAGEFTILANKGLPDQGFYTQPSPGRD